jgi:hypothetical protein
MQYPASSGDLPEFLYRYMSIDKFLQMVLLRQLTVTRIDCFDDPNEAALRPDDELIQHISLSTAGTGQKQPVECYRGSALVTGIQPAFMQSLLHRTLTFASCWTAQADDSAALWSNYASNCGVCIRVQTQALRQMIACIAHCDIRRIEYRSLDAPIRIEADHLTPATLKDRAYAYEREVRVLVYDHIRGIAGYDDWRVKNADGVTEIRIPRHQHLDFAPALIDQVVISPRGHDGHEATIKRLAELLGLKWEIRRSAMRQSRVLTPEQFRAAITHGDPHASPRFDEQGLHVRRPIVDPPAGESRAQGS